jgi:hypothetical protein
VCLSLDAAQAHEDGGHHNASLACGALSVASFRISPTDKARVAVTLEGTSAGDAKLCRIMYDTTKRAFLVDHKDFRRVYAHQGIDIVRFLLSPAGNRPFLA